MAELLAGIGATSGLLCVLLAVFLVASGGALAAANRFLAAFLILSAFDIVGLVGLVMPSSVADALGFRTPLGFLQMPVFYAYIVTLCLPGQELRRHLLFGAGFVGLSLLDMALRTQGEFPIWAQAGLHFQFYVYLALGVLALTTFQKGLAQTRSTDQSIQLRWLWTVIVASFLAHGLVFTRSLAGWLDWPLSWGSLQLASGLSALAILCGLTLTALLRPALFSRLEASEVETVTAPAREMQDPGVKDLATSALAELQIHKYHLEPELSLKTLARRMQVGERDLSQALNQGLGLHFFDFINRARVEHAKQLIGEDNSRGHTLFDIALLSGFNSKSSFNTAFKKHSGLTPSAFRSGVQKV